MHINYIWLSTNILHIFDLSPLYTYIKHIHIPPVFYLSPWYISSTYPHVFYLSPLCTYIKHIHIHIPHVFYLPPLCIYSTILVYSCILTLFDAFNKTVNARMQTWCGCSTWPTNKVMHGKYIGSSSCIGVGCPHAQSQGEGTLGGKACDIHFCLCMSYGSSYIWL